jgi:hypothetical protein
MRRAPALLLLLGAPALAGAMERLADSALSKVAARDGMSFNLSGFAMSGSTELRYTTSDGSGSFSIAYLAASRSDNLDAPFADPYRLDVLKAPGRADIVNLLRPENTAGREVWQLAWDLGVHADGRDVSVGSGIVNDLVFYGGGMQWSTPVAGDGMAFGYSLRSDMGSLVLQPNGRAATGEALVLSNVRIGAAAADGGAPAGPWKIADVTSQPGIYNARTDAAGNPSLHLGIDWPDASGAAVGTLQVGNISFRSDVSGPLDLGASRLGGIQLQYLDIKFRQ